MKLPKIFNYYFVLCYLLICVAFTATSQNNRRTLKIGADNAYYPYEYVNEFNEADGFDIDIIKAIADELNMGYEIESGNWFSIKQKIEKGEIDLLAGMYYHPDRAHKVNFSMPYIIITHSIFVNKGDYWQSLKDVKDQKNLKVVVENSSLLHKYLTTAGISSGRILPVENQLDALKILSESTNTCALLPELQGKYIAQKNGFEDIITVGLPIIPREYSVAINKSDSLLLNQINDAITELNNNGTYERIYNKWFGDYDHYEKKSSSYSLVEMLQLSILILLLCIIIYQYIRYQKFKTKKIEILAKEALENQKTSQILLETESLLRNLTDNTPCPITIVNKDGNFHYVNQKFEEEFGYTLKDIKDLESWFQISIQESDQQQSAIAFIKQFLDRDRKTTPTDIANSKSINITQKNGKSKDFIIKISSIGEGQVMLFFEDITENLKKINQLNTAKIKAESADKQKTSFLANISHEIRTPMNSILGFSSLLAEEDITNEEKNVYSKLIRKNGNILLLLIEDIIDISKIEAGLLKIEPKLVKLTSIIEDAYSSIKEDYGIKIPDPIQFHLKLTENAEHKHYFVKVDNYRLSQVLINILSNAFKYTDKGSIEFGIKELPNRKIRIYVKDTGIGIKKEDQSIIFDRFNRVDSPDVRLRRGTGLGLTISYQILKLFGTELMVESKFNKGSIFYFDLPYYEGHGETIDDKIPAHISYSSTDYNWANKTILLVEDNKENANYIKTTLKKTSAKLIVCETGEKAINIIHSSQAIDLVILDWLLPDMTGDKIVDQIKSGHQRIPIIVVTALALIEDQKEIEEKEVDEYMTKPVEKNNLLHRINYFLNESDT